MTPPIDVVPIFLAERRALLDLLGSLAPEQWQADTVCAGWSVKDIAAHLAADDLGRLSGRRDGFSGWQFAPASPESFEAELRDFINAKNNAWVAAARYLSPRAVVSLLEHTGRETQAYFESLDPNAPGLGVSWAGQAESPNWFDLAREYTERWHHQAQIREAVAAPLLYDEPLFAPVIDTMVHAVPHALRHATGTAIRIAVTGQIERTYNLTHSNDGWHLSVAGGPEASATVTLDGDTAWRLLTRNLPRAEIVRRSRIEGDVSLADAVFDSMALVA